MSFDWLHYLDLASKLYEQAASSRHHDANLRSSISRAYYATYHKSRQFLKDKWGISVPKNSDAHKEYDMNLRGGDNTGLKKTYTACVAIEIMRIMMIRLRIWNKRHDAILF